MCVSGWPGAHHSVDICEGLEEWPGGRDAFHPSDTEDEVLVRQNTVTLDTILMFCLMLFAFLSLIIFCLIAFIMKH